jgi:endonuclease/exonuclease/phosphatase family metal-dependent hydrolase
MKHRKPESSHQILLVWPVLAVILLSTLIWSGGSAQFLAPTHTHGPTSTSAQTQTPIAAAMPSQTFTSTPALLRTIRVISYNVFFGAGVDRQYDEHLPAELRNTNRVPEFVSFINEVRPDILGVQEANGWDGNTSPVVHQVAQQLNMNYYLAQAPNHFNLVLFTKFKILETQNLSGKEGDPVFETMRALRALLLTPDNQSLNVFVVHFDPFSTRTRLYQLDAMIDQLEPYKEQRTIVLGDMNFCVGWLEYIVLRRAGWQPVAVASEVDQIWVSQATGWIGKPLLPLENLPWELSDHLPVVAEFSVYATPVVSFTTTPDPQPDKPLSEEDC